MNRVECAEQNQSHFSRFFANEKFHDELHSHHQQRHHGDQAEHGAHAHAGTHKAAKPELDFDVLSAAKTSAKPAPQELKFDDPWAALDEKSIRPAVATSRAFAQVAGEDLGNFMHQIESDPFVHHVAHDICQDDPVREAVVIGIPALAIGTLSLPFDPALGGVCAGGAFGLTVFGGVPMAIENAMRGK